MKNIGAPDLLFTESRKKVKMNRRVHLRARNVVIQKEQEHELRRERHQHRKAY